jgi:sugar transferase (PEP-CTERM/EpsH1 system associated)
MRHVSGTPPLIAHVVYRFDVGGLENGVANLLNRMESARFRHAVIALTEVTDFRRRVERRDVAFIALRKGGGHGVKLAPRLYRLFRELRPAIVHTRNLAALEASLPAGLARVPVRLHGEHGWDVTDLAGTSRKNRLIRLLYRPFVTHYVALSTDLQRYLARQVGIAPARITQIYNGVDTVRFAPSRAKAHVGGCPFDPAACWVVGTVGRMQAVKDQVTLALAFAHACRIDPQAAVRMRLIIVGDGPQRAEVDQALRDVGVAHLAWLAGARDDVDRILRAMDCFVLPSLAEGISNTVLEAMATGLPVIATRVGGNPELVDDGSTGALVPAGDAEALAQKLLALFRDPDEASRLGAAARRTVERRFSLERMVDDYAGLYDDLLHRFDAAAEHLPAAKSS